MTPKLKSIEEEKADCLAAFKGVQIGDLVEYCHHQMPLEILTKPPENRVNHIMSYKSELEIPKRLRYFRPYRGIIPVCIKKAYKAYLKAYKAYQKSYKDYLKAYKAYQKSYKDFQKAEEVCEPSHKSCKEPYRTYLKASEAHIKAHTAFQKALNNNFPKLASLHNRDHPESPWENILLFPEEVR